MHTIAGDNGGITDSCFGAFLTQKKARVDECDWTEEENGNNSGQKWFASTRGLKAVWKLAQAVGRVRRLDNSITTVKAPEPEPAHEKDAALDAAAPPLAGWELHYSSKYRMAFYSRTQPPASVWTYAEMALDEAQAQAQAQAAAAAPAPAAAAAPAPAAAAAPAPVRGPVDTWSEEDVASWLKENIANNQAATSSLLACLAGINGEMLAALDHSYLEEVCKVESQFSRLLILKKIAEAVTSHQDQSSQSADNLNVIVHHAHRNGTGAHPVQPGDIVFHANRGDGADVLLQSDNPALTDWMTEANRQLRNRKPMSCSDKNMLKAINEATEDNVEVMMCQRLLNADDGPNPTSESIFQAAPSALKRYGIATEDPTSFNVGDKATGNSVAMVFKNAQLGCLIVLPSKHPDCSKHRLYKSALMLITEQNFVFFQNHFAADDPAQLTPRVQRLLETMVAKNKAEAAMLCGDE